MREAIRQAVSNARTNWLDRTIGYFFPRQGLQRLRDRTMLSLAGGYDGARRDRRATQNWNPWGTSADAVVVKDLPALRDRCRDLARNNAIAAGAVQTVVESVVATGLSLQSKPDWKTLGMTEDQAMDWAEDVEQKFRTWAESTDCDITRTQNFYGLQELAYRGCVESGDSFVLLPMQPVPGAAFALRVQVIEGDRCQTPQGMREDEQKISAGIEKDAAGAPVAYHFLRRHPGSMQPGTPESDKVPAFGELSGRRNVLHLFHRTRPGQTRGVPMLSPVIETLKQLGRYTEAEIMGAVLNASFAVFVESPEGEGLQSPGDEGKSESEKQKEVSFEGGQILDLMPGQKVHLADMKRPNAGFDAFMLSLFRQIGSSLGIPHEVLVKHFTASYSASRAAMLEFWRFCRARRAFLALYLCDPVFEAWMEEAVAFGVVPAPGFFEDPLLRRAYLQCEWLGDSPGHVDPTKEVQAALDMIEAGLSNKTDQTLWLTGRNWREVQRQRKREIEIEKRDGTLTEPTPAAAAAPQETVDEEDARREVENATA